MECFRKNVHFSLNGDPWPDTTFNFQFLPAINAQAATETFQADSLNVALVKNLLLQTTLLSDQNRQALEQINPAGVLKNLAVTHVGGSKDWQQYSLKTMFDQLTWSPWHKIPGAQNLSRCHNTESKQWFRFFGYPSSPIGFWQFICTQY